MEIVSLNKYCEHELISNRIWITNARLANMLNRRLKKYMDKGSHPYRFETGEEAIFTLPTSSVFRALLISLIKRFK